MPRVGVRVHRHCDGCMDDSAMMEGNLAQLHESERKRISAERTAAQWVHEMRRGRLNRLDINKRLAEMSEESEALHREALNKFRQRQVRA